MTNNLLCHSRLMSLLLRGPRENQKTDVKPVSGEGEKKKPITERLDSKLGWLVVGINMPVTYGAQGSN